MPRRKPAKRENGCGTVYKRADLKHRPWVAAAPANVDGGRIACTAIGYYATQEVIYVKILKPLCVFLALFLLLSCSALAHSGRTDSNGGHRDSSTGEYHYHHGYPAHQHIDGKCPYAFNVPENGDIPDSFFHENKSGGYKSSKSNKYSGTADSISFPLEICVVLVVIALLIFPFLKGRIGEAIENRKQKKHEVSQQPVSSSNPEPQPPAPEIPRKEDIPIPTVPPPEHPVSISEYGIVQTPNYPADSSCVRPFLSPKNGIIRVEKTYQKLESDVYHLPRSEPLNYRGYSVSMYSVSSSMLHSIGYHSNALYIRLRSGRQYRYYGVPYALYKSFLNSKSLGKFYNSNIKGQFSSMYIGDTNMGTDKNF